MGNSRKLRKRLKVKSITNLEQFRKEYSRMKYDYDYFVSPTLKRAIDSDEKRHCIYYCAKEKIFVCVLKRRISDRITYLLNNKQ